MKPIAKIAAFSALGFALGFGVIYALAGSKKGDTGEDVVDDSKAPVELNWGKLRELNLESFEPSADLRKVDGARVKIPGFIVPLEDSQTQVSEFLLVPSPQACIHVPAPPPNQMVHVKMAGGRKAQMTWGPVWVQGRLKIEKITSVHGDSAYKMVGESTEPYQ